VHDELADEHPQQIIQLSRTRHRRERLLGLVQRLLNGRGKLFRIVVRRVGKGFQDGLEFLPAGLQLGTLGVDHPLDRGVQFIVQQLLNEFVAISIDGRDFGADPFGVSPVGGRLVLGDLDRVFDDCLAAGQDRQ